MFLTLLFMTTIAFGFFVLVTVAATESYAYITAFVNFVGIYIHLTCIFTKM